MVRCRVQYPVPGIKLQEHSPYQAMFPAANDVGGRKGFGRDETIRLVAGRDVAASHPAMTGARRVEG